MANYPKKQKTVDLEKASKDSTRGKKVFIPELRITVFTTSNETAEETRERYLNKSLTYSKKALEDVVEEDIEDIDDN